MALFRQASAVRPTVGLTNSPAATAPPDGKKAVLRMGLLFFIAGLAGCDQARIQELEEGVSTETQVRARFGMPEKTWEARDMAMLPFPGAAAEPGARTLEFNRQLAGTVNYMVTIGPDGRMSALRQVLTPQNFARVLPGMSMEQVRKMLGKPMKVTTYALKRETHYDWRFVNPPSTLMIFTVVFNDDLRVTGTGSVDEESVYPKSR